MADLVIKPATGSGNRLVLKDQLGNEVVEIKETEISTSTTAKVKQKGAFCQSSLIQSWIMGR